MKRYRVIHTIL